MLHPKFIIENDSLIIGKVEYHRDLATDTKNVKGGGWYLMRENTIVFYGESFDFGPAKLEDIKKCVESGLVYFRNSNISNRHVFKYISKSGEITELKNINQVK